jgi:hypothetical protein
MNSTKKKLFFGAGATVGLLAMIALVGQFLITNHLIGANDSSTEIFTRATYPNGFLLVILIPLIATAVLFYGIIRKK